MATSVSASAATARLYSIFIFLLPMISMRPGTQSAPERMFFYFWVLAQLSFRGTVRLNTESSWVESGSLQK